MSRARALLVATTLLGVLGAGPTAAAAEDSPRTPPVPADVATWFTERATELVTSAGATVLDLSTESLAEVAVGTPAAVTTWSPELLAGRSLQPAVQELEQWLAPLTLERAVADEPGSGDQESPPAAGTDAADEPAGAEPATETVPVGVLHARRGETGDVTMDRVTADRELATVLRTTGRNRTLVLDEQTGGWFGYADGLVTPLTEEAMTVLAGTAPLETYQPFLVQRYARDVPGAAPPGSQDAEAGGVPAPLWAAGLLVVLLGAAAGVVWIRRPEEDEGGG